MSDSGRPHSVCVRIRCARSSAGKEPKDSLGPLVALWSVAGGAAYALAGRRWMHAYRAEPDVHGPGESVAWLALLSIVAVAGLVLLLLDA